MLCKFVSHRLYPPSHPPPQAARYSDSAGDHYLPLLLENDPKTTRIHNPVEFFNDLYHRFLLTTQPNMKAMCLQVCVDVCPCMWL